jgi:D-alanyl-D-alanine carboxypeptidase/D-alanyl-D-alanine-endopeptidase (penicillin-binding protein 4)
MKKSFLHLCLFAVSLLIPIFAGPLAFAQGPEALAAHLKKAVQDSGLPAADLGIWVGAPGAQGLQKIFSHNGDRPFVPASLSKLITAAAVLHTLHPDFKFKTQLLSLSAIKDKSLQGSLYLKGGGDPSFVNETMWVLVDEFLRSGITTIDGDIVVDDSRFDRVRFSEERETTRVDRAYDAPVGAMSMNWNSVNVFVRPGAKAGEPCQVFLEPSSSYLRLKNQTTTKSGSGNSLEVERKIDSSFDGDTIQVNGTLGLGHEEVVVYKNISQPDLWAGQNLVEFLRQRGVVFKGHVIKGAAPAAAHVLASVDSKPVSSIISDMAKFSNNYVAEMLVKNLAAENGTQPASMSDGLAIVNKFLESTGLKKGEYSFTNASGFTRENKFKPEQMGRFLDQMRSDFAIFPEYLTALPIAGVDGTLKKRMKNTAAERWVRAKTGLLNGVVGLAGFAGQSNGPITTFVFIYNGSGHEDKARNFFDKMAASLVQN